MKEYGLILKGIGGFYYVKQDGAVHECKARGIFRKQNIKPLPGDHVIISKDDLGYYVIEEILDRKNSLLRPPIANVDVMVIVCSSVEPNINFFLIDQMLVIATINDIEPVIVFTKTDLAYDEAYDAKKMYEHIGIHTFMSDINNHDVVIALKEFLNDKICVFTGNSGVGKSTLINKLISNLNLQTRPISRKLGRGKHTTRQVELLKFGDGYIADTPGFSFIDVKRMTQFSSENIVYGFVEFAKYAQQCKFISCTHMCEKGCRVIQAVDEHKIYRSRYESYVRMVKDLKAAKKRY